MPPILGRWRRRSARPRRFKGTVGRSGSTSVGFREGQVSCGSTIGSLRMYSTPPGAATLRFPGGEGPGATADDGSFVAKTAHGRSKVNATTRGVLSFRRPSRSSEGSHLWSDRPHWQPCEEPGHRPEPRPAGAVGEGAAVRLHDLALRHSLRSPVPPSVRTILHFDRHGPWPAVSFNKVPSRMLTPSRSSRRPRLLQRQWQCDPPMIGRVVPSFSQTTPSHQNSNDLFSRSAQDQERQYSLL